MSVNHRQSGPATSNTCRILVVGIGSPHGDDQAGWRVAQMLIRDAVAGLDVQLARSPSDLLDWMEHAQHLVIIDACRGPDQIGSIHCWNWPAPEIERMTWSGTHDIGLSSVLELGAQLGKLPHDVTIWSIHAAKAEAYQPLSAEVEAAMHVAANDIAEYCRQQLDKTRQEPNDA